MKPLPPEAAALPIVPFLPAIVESLLAEGCLVLAAEPGAGKTSLVPLALEEAFAGRGKILLVEPRRVATVAAAARLAELDESPLGGRIGYRVRGDTRTGPAARIEAVTGGILVRMLQSDPSLAGVAAIVFDEFHERSLDADLGLALALEARELRGGRGTGEGLSLVLMSATLDPFRLAAHLSAPVIDVPGRVFPIETRYATQKPADPLSWMGVAVLEAADSTRGDVLAFLPGKAEILRLGASLAAGARARDLEVLALHGSLPLAEQRRVIAPRGGPSRRLILATSIAETSLTVPRITAVVDSGLARTQRFDARSGLNRLVTLPEARDRADQRRGRAGRLGPGLCLRAWAESELLVERSLPEILGADLSGLVLESLVWGARGRLDLPWLDPPPAGAWDSALELLGELGAVREGVTERGRAMAALGLEPRLAALVLAGRDRGSGRAACFSAALLAEGIYSNSDDFAQLVRGAMAGPASSSVAEEARRLASRAGIDLRGGKGRDDDSDLEGLGPLLASAWPDRVARREDFSGSSAVFALPAGRRLGARPPLAASSWVLALEADAGESQGRLYSGLALSEEEALEALRPLLSEELALEWKGRSYRARRLRRAGALVLASTAAGALPRDAVARALVERLGREGFAALLPDEAAEALLSRLRWWMRSRAVPGAPSFEEAALAREADDWLSPFVDANPAEVLPGRSLAEALEARLSTELRRAFAREAPATLSLREGLAKRIQYDQGPAPLVESRVQDFYGLDVQPRIGGLPLTLRLLSPAGRPVQTTADLPGFWRGAWSEARKELRGRYPKHDWPERPWEAAPPPPRGPGPRRA